MKLFLSILFISLVMACTPKNETIVSIGLDELTSMSADENTVVIDIRTPREVADGYVKGTSKFMNYNDANFGEQIEALDKDNTYIVYCRSGGRSTKALNIMAEKGFKKLYELEGGVLAVPAEKLIK